MSHRSPPDKAGTLDSVQTYTPVMLPSEGSSFHLRTITKDGIRFGGIRYRDERLTHHIGREVWVCPEIPQVLFVMFEEPKLYATNGLYIEADSFVDPEAVDAFLSLRDLIPRPPYKSFFSTTKVVDGRAG